MSSIDGLSADSRMPPVMSASAGTRPTAPRRSHRVSAQISPPLCGDALFVTAMSPYV